ncbi:MAG: multiprotein bridging factor aMBF1 [Candidatus Woesearchaeota archaeon]
MPCEMCGKEGEMVKADIEGAVLVVCKDCGKFGKIISRVKTKEEIKKIKKIEEKRSQEDARPVNRLKSEIIQIIVDDYGNLIKNKREKLGLKQKELARMIAEKESLIQNVECEKFVPSINLARKFERFLKIKLVDQHEEKFEKQNKSKDAALTIGDMLSIKK